MIAAAMVLGAVMVTIGTGSNGVGVMGSLNPGGMMSSTEPSPGKAISIDRAVGIAQQVAANYSGHALVVDEVIEFQNNFYASIRESDSGVGAFEILINRFSGSVSPEPGPNMMWNTAYGMMARGGMMGVVAQPAKDMTVTKERAASVAQGWLDRNLSGTLARPADRFYGHYTVDFEKGGQLTGMLSVNGYSGQVWLHTWHGAYIQTKDLSK
jgi:hypothetical protein